MKTPGRVRQEVAAEIRKRQLWQPGDSVAIAVSGGLDSVCLLDILVNTSGLHGGELTACTVDHAQRTGSTEDADWVEAKAMEYGLQTHRTRLTVSTHSSEAVLRAHRYAWFETLPVNTIALGHHMNDQAETVLLQIMRGSGLAGFRGMCWSRDGFVRPLLGLERSHLVSYAKALDLGWREDPTNLSDAYTRNRLRNEVFPLLEEIRPGAQKGIARSAQNALDDESALAQIAEEWARNFQGECSVAELLALPAAVVRKVFRIRFPGMNANHLDELFACMRREKGEIRIGDNRSIFIEGGRLTVRPLV